MYKVQALMAVIDYCNEQSKGQRGLAFLANPKSRRHSDDEPEEVQVFLQKITHSMLASKLLEDYAMVWEHLVRFWAYKTLHSSTGVVDIFSELTISRRSKFKAITAPVVRPLDVDQSSGSQWVHPFRSPRSYWLNRPTRYVKSMPLFDKPVPRQIQRSIDKPAEWADLTDDADDSECELQYVSTTHEEDDVLDATLEPLQLNRRD